MVYCKDCKNWVEFYGMCGYIDKKYFGNNLPNKPIQRVIFWVKSINYKVFRMLGLLCYSLAERSLSYELLAQIASLKLERILSEIPLKSKYYPDLLFGYVVPEPKSQSDHLQQ